MEMLNSDVIIQFINQQGDIVSVDGRELLKIDIPYDSLEGLSALSVYKEYEILISDISKALKGENVINEIQIDSVCYHTKYIPFKIKNEQTGVLMIWTDVTEQRKAQNRILESELCFRTLFDLATDAIFMMDNKNFVDCNEATLRVFGCKREQIVGETPFRFSPPTQPDGRSSEESAMEKIIAAMEGKAQFFEWQHVHYDGTPFDAEVSLNRLDIGDDVFIQAIVRDITDRKLAELAIQKNNKELLQINEELDRFVYSASHDLRAPIASLLGLVNLLKDETDRNRIKDLITLQERSLKRLDYFIQEIVDYSRNKRLILEIEPIDFKKEFEEAIEQLNFMDNVDKIKKSIKITGNEIFYSDSFRLKIILNNLYSNAIKYADMSKGKPFIKTEISVNDKGAIISVKDNGEGVDLKLKPKLFDMFFRASLKGTGSGLGLYIVKESVEKLGGNIRVESKRFEGTEFIIELPQKKM
jgi:PAS domain S-box-containing protein